MINNIIYIPSNVPLFKFKCVSVETLLSVVKTFKNKANKNDNITTQVLKDSMDYMGFFWTSIINNSLRTGFVPNAWKISNIIPIPKIKNTFKAEEFRPINVLPIHEKLIECIVKNQLNEHIKNCNFLIETQSGFRERHSCETALNCVISSWKDALENGEIIISVFLDFKRAFETVDHEILLMKLKSYGIDGVENDWFRSYMENRKQQTNFENEISNCRENTYGVPQGSVLGPLLFILYINDIQNALENCKINLFADDALLTYSSKDYNSAVLKVNSDLKLIHTWLNANKLKLNINKTKFMTLSYKPVITRNVIAINDDAIEQVTTFKYLGVVIDNKLTFKDHIEKIIKKVSSNVGLLYRLSPKLTKSARLTIYQSVIKPHLEYCSSVLFLCNNCDVNKLQVLQNKAMRIILKRNRRSNVCVMLKDLNWLSVKQLIVFKVMLFIYKMRSGLLPNYLCTKIEYNYTIYNSRSLRNRENFRLPNLKKSASQNSVFYKGVKMFNLLPYNIKTAINVNQFKKLCKLYVTENY